MPEIILREARTDDFRWIVARHGAIYAEEYDWDSTFEALCARIVDDFAAHPDPRQRAWIAELDGERVGCVLSVVKDEWTAQLRLLLVEPSARGKGAGAALVGECIRFARDQGFSDLILWTNHVLVDARRVYERAGFQLIDEESHHSFGHDLIGQTWRLKL